MFFPSRGLDVLDAMLLYFVKRDSLTNSLDLREHSVPGKDHGPECRPEHSSSRPCHH